METVTIVTVSVDALACHHVCLCIDSPRTSGGGLCLACTVPLHSAANAAREEHETISETASFVQHYFDEGELADWFSALETLKYEEFMKYDDSHGEPHYHGLAKLIGKKPQGKA